MIDHCITYFKNKYEERAFRINLTENVRGLLCCLTGKWDEIPRFVDAIQPNIQSEEKEEKTGDEIAEDIMARAGLSFRRSTE